MLPTALQLISKAKCWRECLVWSECLSSESPLALEETSFVGDSTVREVGTEIRKSFVSVVVEVSSTLVKVFFLTWCKCLLTLLPSVRSAVNEAGPVFE